MSKTKLSLFIFLLSVIVYLPFVNSPLFWDDEQFIYNNQFVRQFAVKKIFTTNTVAGAGEVSNYYRPLTTLSLVWDYQFWQTNPIGYHLTNLILHGFAGVVLFWLLCLLQIPLKASLLISTLFVIHPLQTEAVAYANSRGDSLYSLFGLLNLLLVVLVFNKKSKKLIVGGIELELNRWLLAAGEVLFYLAAILSKEIGLALLGLIWLVILHQLIKEHGLSISNWIKKLFAQPITLFILFTPVLVALIYLWLRSGPLKFAEQLNPYQPGYIYGESVLVRLNTFAKVLFIYARLLFVPYPLYMERTTQIVTSTFSGWAMGVVGIATALFFLGKREYQTQKSIYIWFGGLWFIFMLVPVSGIVPINDILYEHWLYLPMIGFWLMIYGIWKLLMISRSYQNLTKILPKSYKLLLGTWMATLILLSWRQNYLWSNPIRFYLYTLSHQPTARVHNNLAMAYADINQLELAIEHYQKALEFGIEYPQIYNNLGNTWLNLEEYQQAKEAYQKAIALNPSLIQSQLGLIQTYLQTQEFELAYKLADNLQQIGVDQVIVERLKEEIEVVEKQKE